MQSKKVFITTDGFICFIDRAKPKHLHAGAYFRYFAQQNLQLYTTDVVINESYSALANTISPSIARDFIRALQISSINIIYPEEPDIKKSMRLIAESQSAELTLGDALTAIICDKRSIPQVYTFSYFPSLFGLHIFYLPI